MPDAVPGKNRGYIIALAECLQWPPGKITRRHATKSAAADTYRVKEVNLLNVQDVTPFFEKLYDATYDLSLIHI